MKEKIKLSNGDEVWIGGKKSMYRVLYPHRNEDGTWNVKNLFHGWQFTILVVLIVVFAAWSYRHDIAACKDLIENPIKYGCYGYNLNMSNVSQLLYNPNISVSLEKIDFGKADNLSVPPEKDDPGVFKVGGD